MSKEKLEVPLSHNQKLLQSLAGQQANRDWSENLGNERLRMSRVMVAKLIRTGDDDVLDIVAEYLGTRIIRDSAIQAEMDTYTAKGIPVTFDQVRKFMERKSK